MEAALGVSLASEVAPPDRYQHVDMVEADDGVVIEERVECRAPDQAPDKDPDSMLHRHWPFHPDAHYNCKTPQQDGYRRMLEEDMYGQSAGRVVDSRCHSTDVVVADIVNVDRKPWWAGINDRGKLKRSCSMKKSRLSYRSGHEVGMLGR